MKAKLIIKHLKTSSLT